MPRTKRVHPSARIGELPDGTIVRAPAAESGWFYSQKWNGAMVVYAHIGQDDRTLDDIVRLPVAFVMVHYATSMFWNKFWKPRPEVVGTIRPMTERLPRDVTVDLARRLLRTWDAETGVIERPVTFEELDGVLVGAGLTGEDVVERLRCTIDGIPWPRELRVDHRTWTVDRHGQPVLRAAMLASSLERDLSPMSLLELAPENPDFVEDMLSETPGAAMKAIEEAIEFVVGHEDYLDRDDGGRAVLASALVAFALVPAIADEFEADESMKLVAKKIRTVIRPAVVTSARAAIRRVLRTDGDLGSGFAASSPATGEMVARIGEHLSRANVPS